MLHWKEHSAHGVCSLSHRLPARRPCKESLITMSTHNSSHDSCMNNGVRSIMYNTSSFDSLFVHTMPYDYLNEKQQALFVPKQMWNCQTWHKYKSRASMKQESIQCRGQIMFHGRKDADVTPHANLVARKCQHSATQSCPHFSCPKLYTRSRLSRERVLQGRSVL